MVACLGAGGRQVNEHAPDVLSGPFDTTQPEGQPPVWTAVIDRAAKRRHLTMALMLGLPLRQATS